MTNKVSKNSPPPRDIEQIAIKHGWNIDSNGEQTQCEWTYIRVKDALEDYKKAYDTLQAELDELKKNWKELELEQVKHIEIITEQYHSRLERAESILSELYNHGIFNREKLESYFAEVGK